MPIIPYASRAITLQFELGNGESFDNTGSNVLTITGLQVVVSFVNAILPALPSCVMRINGMTLDQMNRLTVAGMYIYSPNRIGKNVVRVSAGIVGGQMSTIFSGRIIQAYPDGEQPNMGFFVRALYDSSLTMGKITPTSFNGSVSAATVMQAVCTKAGIGFENNNVNVVLANPYFSGTARDQLGEAAKAAGAYLTFDCVAGRAAVWPKLNGSRPASNTVVSAQHGMIGYPQFESGSIRVRTIYDPTLLFAPGVPFSIQTQFAAANGSWVPANVSVDISSQMPKGPWEIGIMAYPIGYPPSPNG